MSGHKKVQFSIKKTKPTSAGRPKSTLKAVRGSAEDVKEKTQPKDKEIVLDYSVDNLDAESDSEPEHSDDADAAADAAASDAATAATAATAAETTVESKTSIKMNKALPNIELNNLFSFPVKKKPIEERKYTPPTVAEIIYFTANNRITSEVMTRYEYCEVISIRAKQLENSELCFTDPGTLTDPIAIAKKEIADKRCPLRISRCICDNKFELWDVNEMAIPVDIN
jgi:DNA-directed RNA polymerase I, II, and III subunit RPABC2